MKAVTANRLADGAVVYLGAYRQWTADMSEAARFDDNAAADALGCAEQQVREVAGAYLIDVDQHGAPAGRQALREAIRSAGPTIRPDLGYQAGA